MKYKVLCEDKELSLIDRLLKIRGISDNITNFLDPKLKDYWLNPRNLNDMKKWVDRILNAIKNKEKIMIFGDYDVDGVTSSFILYKFFTKYLNYKYVSIMYPDRIKDGYGMKNKHLDEIKEKWVDLVITVDNGITSIWEVKYAKKIWIDVIITDHHKNLEELPDAVAVINPIVSEKYRFKYLAGVWVVFKMICALLDATNIFNINEKNKIFNYFLPIAAIGTVADIVPLVNENRLIVKRWLELMNNGREGMSTALKWLLNYLNLKEVDTFHIGFVIGPRINAWWRIDSPYNSLKMLLFTWEKQLEALKRIDEINADRKKLQEEAFKKSEESLDLEQKIIISESEDFHEWIVGIVSGKLTEKYHKPSVVFKIDKDKWHAVASLRWPDYFDIVAMLQKYENLLERFGWHKHAGWLTIKLDKLEEFKDKIIQHCNEYIKDEDLEKTLHIDTKIFDNEWNYDLIQELQKLAPFGEWNSEPNFLFEKVGVEKVEKVGKNGSWHMKIHWNFGDNKIKFLFWWKGDMIKNIEKEKEINIVGKIKKDDFNWWYFVNGVEIL